jgi:hypothetical protein
VHGAVRREKRLVDAQESRLEVGRVGHDAAAQHADEPATSTIEAGPVRPSATRRPRGSTRVRRGGTRAAPARCDARRDLGVLEVLARCAGPPPLTAAPTSRRDARHRRAAAPRASVTT